MVSPGIRNVLVTGVVALVLYRCDPENSWVVTFAQATVLGHLFLGLFLNFYIRRLIKKNEDTATVRVPRSYYSWKRVPADQDEWLTMTTQEYDLEELKRTQHRFVLNAAFLGFAVFRIGATRAGILQGLLWIIQILESPLVQIYIFYKPATGLLARPFQKSTGLLDAVTRSFRGDATTTTTTENKKDN
ncbi:hypothetical protein GAYE_SCF72G6975 [Galdieria yellowstonensis]|uniref:Inorganic phosphate transporter n=1 Tax=Galdieria yellowstonensis TaxID=3028027 RepID=A0AAV9INM6_9RHOD|nr:hypothetical protein GAYE_SCF72G6975 [Galdieria yellowstonensis]